MPLLEEEESKDVADMMMRQLLVKLSLFNLGNTLSNQFMPEEMNGRKSTRSRMKIGRTLLSDDH
jgi:hypothetical protein